MRQRPKRKLSSPTRGRRACLCKNGTYSRKCCTGELHAQGVGVVSGNIKDLTSEERNSYLLSEAEGLKLLAE